ncbi:tyrosine-type recombinase/integrase [Neorhizobium galegae]|nr:tyrosine-type recombinase/integrase [Neorhizobium galegae]
MAIEDRNIDLLKSLIADAQATAPFERDGYVWAVATQDEFCERLGGWSISKFFRLTSKPPFIREVARIDGSNKTLLREGEPGPKTAASVAKHMSKETHYEMWTDADIAKFREKWGEGTPQRVALEILVYTGLRRSDAVKLGPKHLKDGFFTITARKTGVELNIPIHPKLLPYLRIRNSEKLVNIRTYISTAYGKPRSEKAFTNWIIEAATEAGLSPHRSPHGLRRAACRALAEAGCTVWEIMAITGHQNAKEVQGYVDDIDKKKLASSAMKKWEAVS